MIRMNAPLRGWDKFGGGHFGASRGGREHNGIDYEIIPGAEIFTVGVSGQITKHGYVYADDSTYRYIEITDENEYRHRYFYVSPEAELGDHVTPDDVIGIAQNIADRYPGGMTAHVHYEIKTPSDGFIDPEAYNE